MTSPDDKPYWLKEAKGTYRFYVADACAAVVQGSNFAGWRFCLLSDNEWQSGGWKTAKFAKVMAENAWRLHKSSCDKPIRCTMTDIDPARADDKTLDHMTPEPRDKLTETSRVEAKKGWNGGSREETMRLAEDRSRADGSCLSCLGSGYERYLGRDNSEEVIDCTSCGGSGRSSKREEEIARYFAGPGNEPTGIMRQEACNIIAADPATAELKRLRDIAQAQIDTHRLIQAQDRKSHADELALYTARLAQLEAEILSRQSVVDAAVRVAQKWEDAAQQATQLLAEAVKVLEAARSFIVNGVEFGFVRMPDENTPDPAYNTLPMINALLSRLREVGE